MTTSDWSDACDPVPARRELTEAEKRRLQALMELRRRQGFRGTAKSAPSTYRVEPDFDCEEGR